MTNTFIRFLCWIALSLGVAHAESVTIPSLDGKLQLSAYWLAAPGPDPKPAVITLHGCDGLLTASGQLGSNYLREAAYFNAEKIHLLALDSFGARGIKSICDIPSARRSIDEEDRRADVFAAIKWLAAQPNVDKTRIAVIGRSHGAHGQKDAVITFHVFPDSYHAFDSTKPVRIMENIGNTKSGTATVGGNPAAREISHQMTFDFLSAQFSQPLLLSHEQRLKLIGHNIPVPAATGFADINADAAVPVKPEGRSRYVHYLGLQSPKAFAITEKGGWFFSDDSAYAMSNVFDLCDKFKLKCWLYAVDDHVVWQSDPAKRITRERLQQAP